MTTPLDFTARHKIVNGVWDSRDSGGAATLRLSGTGFGNNGPTVVLFDDFRHGAEEVPIGRVANIGQWKNPVRFGEGRPTLQWDVDGFDSRWFAIRDPLIVDGSAANRCALYYEFPDSIQEFRVGLRSWSPIGYNYPGATGPQEIPGPSSNKPLWLAQRGSSNISGTEFPNANLVLNSHSGGGNWSVSGNDTNPSWLQDGSEVVRRFSHDNSFVVPTVTTYYQSGVEDATDPVPFSETIDFMALSDQPAARLGSNRACAINQPAVSVRGYGAFSLGAWIGNQPNSDFSRVQLYLSDVYVAVGENSRACVVLSNAATIAASTIHRLVPPATWSDEEITIKVAGDGLMFAHVITAAGELIEGIPVEVIYEI